MQLTIRNAVIDDYKAIAAISREDLGYDCSDELVRLKLEKLDTSREAVFAAVCDNCVIGYVHAEKYDTLYFETLVNILGLAVKSDSRRIGAGRRLMEAAECWAKENGAVGVRLNSGITRTGAHDFYRAVGYNSEKQQMRFMKKF